MKVSELIAQLSVFDPDMDVSVEGCDCINDAKCVTSQAPGADERWRSYVLIEAELG